jgi:hypothetical protein
VPVSPDPACPSTSEELLIHGANAVCGVPVRPVHDRRSEAALALSGALALAFGFALVRRRGLSPTRVGILLLAACAVAGPGLRAVLVDRADAPLREARSTQEITTLVSAMDAFASARHDCIQEVRNDCLECQPMVRFVLPDHASCAHPRGRIELRRNALAAGCVVHGDTLECGSSAL